MEALLLVLAGLFGGIGQLLLTESYRHADASTIATFEYSSMLWGILIGYLAFADVPTGHVVVGSAIVVASGLFIAYREHRLGMRRPPSPAPRTLPG
jgi:drug/metabolite transporter (DMT)-like permease